MLISFSPPRVLCFAHACQPCTQECQPRDGRYVKGCVPPGLAPTDHKTYHITTYKGEVIDFRLFRATELAFAIRPKDGVARQHIIGWFRATEPVFGTARPKDSVSGAAVTKGDLCIISNFDATVEVLASNPQWTDWARPADHIEC